MTNRLATAAHLITSTDLEGAADAFSEPITGWHALVGLPIGILRGFAPGTDVEVCIERVLEQSDDLAVADRVAWVLAGRTGRPHVVLASSTGYLVTVLALDLDWAAVMRMEPGMLTPRVVSVATGEGVLPILHAAA